MNNQSIKQSNNQTFKIFFPHIDNQVQHIQEELMWESWSVGPIDTYNTYTFPIHKLQLNCRQQNWSL